MKKWAFWCGLIVILGCGGLGGGTDDPGPSPEKDYFVYTVNQTSNDVSIMQGDTDGHLAACGTVKVGSQPSAIAYNGQGYLFVANTGDNTISCFTVAKSGNLYLQSTVPTGPFPDGIAFGIGGPTTTQLFVSCRGENAVRIYTVGSKAKLTFRGQVNTGTTPLGLASREGTLYVCNAVGGTVSQFHIGDGTLTPLNPPTIKAGSVPESVVCFGQATYVLNQGDTISEYTGAGQALVANGTVATPHTPSAFAIDSTGRAVYVANDTLNSVSVYNADDHLKLTRASGTEVSGGTFPTAIGTTAAPQGLDHGAVYVADRSGDVRGYWIDQNHALTALSTVNSLGSMPVGMAITDNIGIDGPAPFAIATTALANGSVGTGYEAHLAVAGGMNTNDAYWSVSAGTLPPGLALTMDANLDESLTGNPTQAGTYTFTLQAQQGKFRATRQFTVVISTVGTPLQISTISLPTGTVGTAYDGALTLSGGNGTQTANWSVTTGALPTGLVLDANPATNQHLHGTPTAAGAFAFTLKVVQGAQTVTRTFTVNVTSVTPTTARFLNVCSGNPDQTLSLTVAGTTFTGQGRGGTLSTVHTPTSTGASMPYSISGPGGNWPAGTVPVVANARNLYVAMGSIAANRKLVAMSFASGFPFNAGISFIDGIDAGPDHVDVYLLDAGGNEVGHQFGMIYGTWQTWAVPTGDYHFKVTVAGQPTNIVVNGSVQTLTLHQNRVNMAISIGDWGANYIQTLESP